MRFNFSESIMAPTQPPTTKDLSKKVTKAAAGCTAVPATNRHRGANRAAVPAVRVPRGAGFSNNETKDLLDDIKDLLPVGNDEWDLVWKLHDANYPEKNRNPLLFQQKFTRLCRAKPPTGDLNPNIHVARALELEEVITEKMQLSNGETKKSS
jgi:hypothetical protein